MTDKEPMMVAAEGLKWEDTFFAETEGIVAVFDFDYDAIINFDWQVTKTVWVICPQVFIVGSLCCQPCFALPNIKWRTRAQHVAVHRDGIKFVTDRRKSLCGLSCSDQGKNSKTVPFDKLTDCDVQEPAGTAVFCCVPNVLHTVTVDTASSGQVMEGGGVRHELQLRGLKDPHAFKKCVWDCKRGSVNFGGSDGISGVTSGMNMDDRGGGGGKGDGATTALLSEIRDELRAQNKTKNEIRDELRAQTKLLQERK
jgi:hypothetical protein